MDFPAQTLDGTAIQYIKTGSFKKVSVLTSRVLSYVMCVLLDSPFSEFVAANTRRKTVLTLSSVDVKPLESEREY